MAKTKKLKITHAEIRMYRMGTGDCFILKFFSDDTEQLKMMIDCGVWIGSKVNLTPFVEDLKEYVNNEVDILIVTHEHKDHVHVFEACKELFTTDFKVGKIWMGWTEDDKKAKVKKWKTEYGEKKIALKNAAIKMANAINKPAFAKQFSASANGNNIVNGYQQFNATLNDFCELSFASNAKEYKGDLEGMRIVKEEIANNNIEYFEPGDIIEDVDKADGLKFYILAPSAKHEDILIEEAPDDEEGYSHNKALAESDSFAAALNNNGNINQISPFSEKHILSEANSAIKTLYHKKDESWRNIDMDWLQSAGALALRMNSITNNLSLVLAIEFEDQEKVILLPGDAEYGSWKSWHEIDWTQHNLPANYTERLLNKTIFYKVAHHSSHHGTAKKQGLNMMIHKDLTAMATLDYDIIAKAWKGTMPNQGIVDDLLKQTKGRTIFMQTKDIYADANKTVKLETKIKAARKKMNPAEAKKFSKNLIETDLYYQFTIRP